jgi:hypothetical protein
MHQLQHASHNSKNAIAQAQQAVSLALCMAG